MSVLLFLLVSYGISNIIVFGSIFESLRTFLDKVNPSFFGQLVKCMICTPMWTGSILSFILSYLGYTNLTPFGSIGLDVMWVRIFLDGCLTSGVCWLIHTLQEKLER